MLLLLLRRKRQICCPSFVDPNPQTHFSFSHILFIHKLIILSLFHILILCLLFVLADDAFSLLSNFFFRCLLVCSSCLSSSFIYLPSHHLRTTLVCDTRLPSNLPVCLLACIVWIGSCCVYVEVTAQHSTEAAAYRQKRIGKYILSLLLTLNTQSITFHNHQSSNYLITPTTLSSHAPQLSHKIM